MLQATTHDPNYADPHEVADYAATLTEAYLQCRETGHNWTPWTAYPIKGGYERALRCVSCQTKRWETLDSYGGKVKGHYEYPDDYLHEGLGRIVGDGRNALRLESVTRVMTEAPPGASGE